MDERWTIKKVERWRIDAFEIWYWRRLLRVPWTARRSNQSILKEISPEYSLEGLMLKLKLQYFGHLVGRADSFEKTLLLGKTEGMRRRGRQRMRWLDVNTDSMDCVPGTIHLRSLCLCSSHFKLGIKASWSAGAIRGLQFFLGYKAYNSSCLRSPMGSKHNLCRLLY